ncbi:MAG: DUF4126 domain-containing protein [Phycisphaerae bacterium]|nr:DUF4126 domain-containing protein [Phycisphaerae bacterium]
MDAILAVIVGLGLAAACGLRAFVPVLGIALASKAGFVTLGPSFEWLASWPAIAALGVATAAEITSSLVPVVAHALDAVAAPVATVAGGLVMASQLGGPIGIDIEGMNPMLQWGAGLIAGGGIATAVHAGSATVRAGSSTVSAGLLAPVYGAIETVLAFVASVLAVVVPILFATLVGAVLAIAAAIIIYIVRRRLARRPALATA